MKFHNYIPKHTHHYCKNCDLHWTDIDYGLSLLRNPLCSTCDGCLKRNVPLYAFSTPNNGKMEVLYKSKLFDNNWGKTFIPYMLIMVICQYMAFQEGKSLLDIPMADFIVLNIGMVLLFTIPNMIILQILSYAWYGSRIAELYKKNCKISHTNENLRHQRKKIREMNVSILKNSQKFKEYKKVSLKAKLMRAQHGYANDVALAKKYDDLKKKTKYF